MDEALIDLIKDWRLESIVQDTCTVHNRHVSDPAAGLWRRQVQERWQRKRELGRGSFGVVWLEECVSGPSQGRLRAVKELRKTSAGPPADDSKELAAILKFSHERYQDCFVRSFGWFETDRSTFITMEYLPLGDLEHYLAKPLPEDQACTISQQVLQGLAFMHENKFAHRDLKPSNILVFYTEPRWWVKISDFGISKRIGGTDLRTRTGTEGYLAPEVYGFYPPGDRAIRAADAGKAFSLAIDIWSMGAIIFRMVTGRIPFRNAGELSRYVSSGTPALADSLMGSDDCTQLVLEAMDVSPQMRPTAQQALERQWIQDRRPDSLDCGVIGANSSPSTVPVHIDNHAEEATITSVASARWEDTTAILPSANPAPQSLPIEHSSGPPRLSPTRHSPSLTRKSLTLPIQSNRQPLVPTRPSPSTAATEPNTRTELPNISNALPSITQGRLKPAQSLMGHLGQVCCVAFSPDSRWLASGSIDATILLWRANSHNAFNKNQKLEGARRVESLAFSSDGRLASAAADASITLWGADREGQFRWIQQLDGHRNIVNSVAFSADGGTLASCSFDNTIVFWKKHASSGKLYQAQRFAWNNSAMVLSVAFSAATSTSPRMVSTFTDLRIAVWGLDSGGRFHEIQVLEGLKESVYGVAFSPDGRLVTGSCDAVIVMWEEDREGRFQQVQRLTGHTNMIHSVAFSPDGRRLASGAADGDVLLWEAGPDRQFRQIQKLQGHNSGVYSVAFSPDSRWLASSSKNGKVLIWEADGRTEEY